MKEYLSEYKGKNILITGIEKARRVLGYEPKRQIKDGVKQAFDWIRENHEKIDAGAKF